MASIRQGEKRVYGAIAATLMLALAIWVWGAVLSYFNSGASWDKPDYSNQQLDAWSPGLEWLESDLDISIDPFLKAQFGKAYLRAWQSINAVLHEKDSTLLNDFFAPALSKIISTSNTASDRIVVEQADLSHQVEITMISYDKQLVAFTDRQVRLVRRVHHADRLVLSEEQVFDFDVIMTLDDGRWRVRHMTSRDAAIHLAATRPVATNAPISIHNKSFYQNGELLRISGTNYYPQHAPWFDFWEVFDTSVISSDLRLIRDLGLNTVRLFIPFELFGGKVLDPEKSARLGKMLELLEENELYAVLTLFDFPPGYDIKRYSQTETHLAQLLAICRNSDRILAYDIKNEPDLDFDRWGEQQVLQWLEFIIRKVRTYDPGRLVTIGWSDPSAATLLAEQVDFVSFHYFKSPAGFENALDTLRRRVDDKLVMLSEFGLPTFSSFVIPGGHSESRQANYYATIISTLEEREHLPWLFWGLYDFPEVPLAVTGRLPWRVLPQKNYGVFRTDASAKPAVQTIRSRANEIPRVGLKDLLRPIHLTYVVILLVLILLSWRLSRRVFRN